MQEWKDWAGGKRPLPKKTKVALKFRDGVVQGGRAGDHRWSHRHPGKGGDRDIIAYAEIGRIA